MIDLSTLKACRFCASNEASMSFAANMESADPACRFVECDSCGACGPFFKVDGDDDRAKQQAYDAWNAAPPAREIYIVWNEAKNEGFATDDEQDALACLYGRNRLAGSTLGIAMADTYDDDDLTMETVRLPVVANEPEDAA